MRLKKKMKESKAPSSKWKYRIAARPMNESEEQRFSTAIELYLTEWVRRQIEEGNNNDSAKD